MQLNAASPTTPTPIGFPGLAPEPARAVDDLTELIPRMGAAADRHREAVANQVLDTEAMLEVITAGSRAADAVHALSIGRSDAVEQRREIARGFAARYAEALGELPGIWAVPPDAMKALLNIERGAERLAAAARRPGVDLTRSDDGWGLNQSVNGMRQLAASLHALDGPIAGPGFRTVGLLRATRDAVRRIEDGISAASAQLPFRAGKQADTALRMLQHVHDEGADLVTPRIGEALESAIAGAAGVVDRDGHTFPAGADAYIESMRRIADAARTVTQELETAAAPVLQDSTADASRLRAWLGEDPARVRGPYPDADIGF